MSWNAITTSTTKGVKVSASMTAKAGAMVTWRQNRRSAAALPIVPDRRIAADADAAARLN
jgi:hypothetical protein